MIEYRIGIVGGAGSGKTTLASALSDRLEVPLLKAKDITSLILQRDEYDYASDIQVERFLAQGNRQEEILEKTIEREIDYDSYVTDRTVIDLAAYSVAELYDSDQKKINTFFEVCHSHAGRYTHLIFCPWGNHPIKNNQIRTLNRWYQFIIHSLGLYTATLWDVEYHMLNSNDNDERVEESMKYILG